MATKGMRDRIREEIRQGGENCKNPPDLRLGLQKTTIFEEIFKNPPVFTLTVATGADRPY
jgi:hypothetical protein